MELVTASLISGVTLSLLRHLHCVALGALGTAAPALSLTAIGDIFYLVVVSAYRHHFTSSLNNLFTNKINISLFLQNIELALY